MKLVLRREAYPNEVINPWSIWKLPHDGIKQRSPQGWYNVVPNMQELDWQINWYMKNETTLRNG